MKICWCELVHDDPLFGLPRQGREGALPRHVFISRVSWSGRTGCWERTLDLAHSLGAEVHVGDWTSEDEHRRAAQEILAQLGFTHAIIADADEVLEDRLLDALLKVAEADLADRVYVEWDTYWKDVCHVIRPRERFTPCMLINLAAAVPVHLRGYAGGRGLFLDASHGIAHHLSYAGGDERIWNKITDWSHKDEVVPHWWEGVWKGWDLDPFKRSLHPTHPDAYQFAERISTPALLAHLAPESGPEELRAPQGWPRIRASIPVQGGQEDLDKCLQSLAQTGLVDSVCVVDNGSEPPVVLPDTGALVVQLIRNEQNLGFAAASNQGVDLEGSDVTLFLNSDTVVPRAGLLSLIEALMSERSIAAAGPYTNRCGHFQQIDPTYTELANLDFFAEDFSRLGPADRETDMLVGFCLAVKNEALKEAGLFDEGFGLGTFEDNDLCHRLRRSGWRLVIAGKAFVHHEGSKTMRRMAVRAGDGALDLGALLEGNRKRYEAKWRDDLESGFASSLSGLSPNPIQFNSALKPEKRLAALAREVRQADISLCMIVRNEERVIGDCLASVKPFVREILITDTGSTDRTVEICRAAGAVVSHMEWPDSFAAARNRSMEQAAGSWILWLDADDTLPLASGEAIVQAAARAARDVAGFVIPVRFLEEQGHGTEVDHVKLFRRLPGITWEGRIHEQILPSLRHAAREAGIPGGGKIVRLPVHVLHSGYDTSPEGQARKKERDEKLLRLDLEERPEHPFVLFNLGMTAHYTGEHEEAVSWLRRSIDKAERAESHVRKAYALLGASLKLLGRSKEAEAVLLEGQARVEGDPEISFHLAQIAADQGRHLEAIELYKTILTADISGHFTSIDPGILGWKARHNMALSFMALGDYESARDQWERGLSETGRPELAAPLVDASLQAGRLDIVRKVLAWADGAHPGSPLTRQLRELAERGLGLG